MQPGDPATNYENEWYNSAILASGRRKRVEATEIAETIHGGHEAHSAEGDATFRRFAAIYLGIVAMLLAIASLGGSNATKVMLSANIQASDTYGFYQSRNIRQTIFQTFAEELEAQLLAQPDMPEAAKAKFEAAIKRYHARVERYESDPATGDGKKELLAKAKEWEAKRDHAAERDPNFDFAEALFQIAIVIGSVSIVAVSRSLIKLSAGLAIVASLLMINGFFLIVHLPFE
jgi:hypothetical protein